MSLDVMYINKAEEMMKKEHNPDLQSSTEALHRANLAASAAANSEPKGDLVNVPVIIKGVEVISYVMRMGDKMPAFNYWPRGKEIIQRLVLRAAVTKDINELNLYRTSDEAIYSIMFEPEYIQRFDRNY